ncbi:MAG: hypothetical protein ACKVTZ_01640, partial [Bacteroidia bacterium]
MKKFLLAFLAVGAFSGLQAQFDVTFQVDMRTEMISPNGLHIAGAMQTPNVWQPGVDAVTDGNGDGIYEFTFTGVPAGTYEYKFVNGNDWSGPNNNPENIPAACAVNGNRQVVVTGNMTVPVHAFNSCDPNPAGNPLTFRVNI